MPPALIALIARRAATAEQAALTRDVVTWLLLTQLLAASGRNDARSPAFAGRPRAPRARHHASVRLARSTIDGRRARG